MSLINDALKKAQRQRTGDSPLSQPPMPGGTPAPARPARANNSPSPQLLLVGVGAVLGLLLATGTILFFRQKPTATVSTSTTQAQPSKDSTSAATVAAAPLSPSPTAKAPAESSAPPSASAPGRSQPAGSLPVVKTESSTATTTLVGPTHSPSEKTAPADVVAAPVAPPAPSLRMIEAIEAFRVAGIRAGTGSDAKVLMNDRVYRIGDTVDHALGIKLTVVNASALTFRDNSGATYTRNF